MSEDQTNLTLRQRKRLQQSDGAPLSASPSKRGYRGVLVSVGLVALVSAAAWAWFHFHRGTDPRLAEISDLMAQAGKLDNPMSKEAMDLRDQIGKKMKDLPDDLKSQIMDKGRGMFQARADKFFASSSKDQLAQLDMLIMGAQAAEALQKAKDAIAGTPPTNSGADSAKTGPGGRGGRSDAQKTQGWQKRLANTSPTQRAQWTLGIQMYNARVQQQGGTAVPSGGFF